MQGVWAIADWWPWWLLILAGCLLPAWGRKIIVVVKPYWHDCHIVVASNHSVLAWHNFSCFDREKNHKSADLQHRLTEAFVAMSPAYTWSRIQRMTFVLNDRSQEPLNADVHRGVPFPLHFTDEHHMLHALYAAYTSPFNRAVVVTVDGCGPGGYSCEAFVVWSFSRTPKGHRLRKLAVCSNCRYGMIYLGCPVSAWELDYWSLFTPPNPIYLNKLTELIAKTLTYTKASVVFEKFFKANPPSTPAKVSAVQNAIMSHAIQHLRQALSGAKGVLQGAEGIAFGGGVAANTRLPLVLGQDLNLSTWRPALPGDGSLGFGQLWRTDLPFPMGHRPAVTFLGLPLPSMPPVLHRLQCVPFQAVALARLLRQKALVGWMVHRDTLGAASYDGPGWGGPGWNTPGHRSIVSCYPIHMEGLPLSHTPNLILIDSALVSDYFYSPTTLLSPSHAFLLEARGRLQEAFNTSHATVAPVEGAQDPFVDLLLTAAKACPLPLLFTHGLTVAQLPTLLANGGLQHVVWEERLCSNRSWPRPGLGTGAGQGLPGGHACTWVYASLLVCIVVVLWAAAVCIKCCVHLMRPGEGAEAGGGPHPAPQTGTKPTGRVGCPQI